MVTGVQTCALPISDSSLLPPRPVRARFVRVMSTGSLVGLREVSVWDGQPVAAGVVTGAPTGTVSSPSHRSRTGWLVGAALAAGVALGALGAVAALRRRSAR